MLPLSFSNSLVDVDVDVDIDVDIDVDKDDGFSLPLTASPPGCEG